MRNGWCLERQVAVRGIVVECFPGDVIVTGSPTGIGFATALRLAREGHAVYATVRSESSGAALVEAAGDLPVRLVVLDVDSDESVASGIGGVTEAEGHVDVLVNNAGVSGGVDIESTPIAAFQFQSVMNTNAWGLVRCSRAVLPAMCERERPINFESPYFGVTFRTSRLLMSGLNTHATTPDKTAEVIWTAISTDSPRLRYKVGIDAATLVAARSGITDEDWLATLNSPDDARRRARMTSAPETTGSSGNVGDVEGGDYRPLAERQRKLFQVQGRRLCQVAQGFSLSLAFGHRTGLRIQRAEATLGARTRQPLSVPPRRPHDLA